MNAQLYDEECPLPVLEDNNNSNKSQLEIVELGLCVIFGDKTLRSHSASPQIRVQ